MRNSPSKTNGRSMSEPFDSDGGQCGGSSAPTLEALYRTYAARLLGTLRAECDGNLEDAKDLSQRIWLVIARRIQTITIEHPWPFIEKVMTDEVNGAFRLKSRRNGKLDLLVPLIEPVKPPELKETSPELWGCLERLSQLDQSIVMSFYGLSRRRLRGSPVHVSRPTPPYLRVVSNRAFQLEVEEEEPPQPLTDEEQAQALTEERQEQWSPRRVKVRRCRALSALALCLKEHGLTGSSQRSPWKEEDTGEGGESMETSRGPLRQLLTRSSPSGDGSDGLSVVHPPAPLLLLTFGETEHPAQQHLQVCSSCQASLAALQSVEAQLMQASQLHRAHWERIREEQLALEDVWATVQLTLSSDDSPAVAVQPESPSPSAPSPQELPEEPILIVETEEAGAEVPMPSAPSGPIPQQDSTPTAKVLRLPHISRGWKVLGGIALAAGLLLALGLGRQAADPFGLGDAGQTRGGGDVWAALAMPTKFGLETQLVGGHGWHALNLSRDLSSLISWRGQYPTGASLRLSVSPPLSSMQRWLAQVGLGASWSGTLECGSGDLEDHTGALKMNPSTQRFSWQQQHADENAPLQIPLPTSAVEGEILDCWLHQTLGRDELPVIRFALESVATGSASGR